MCKKTLQVILFCLIISTVTGCNYFRNVHLLTGGSLAQTDFVQVIPFEYHSGLIVVRARINQDSTDREFIFDTGAFNSKVEKELSEQLGIPTVAYKENGTAQGITRRIEVGRLDSLTLGETVFRNIGAGKVVFDSLSASPCVAPDGLIGANVIKLANWKIDYDKQLIYFSDKPFPTKEDEVIDELKFDRPALSGTPIIQIKINDRQIEGVLFDTGFNGGLIVPSSITNAFEGPSQTYIDRSISGIYGTNIDTLTEKTLEVLIGASRTMIPVEFSSIGKALLGNDILEHFNLIVDNQQNRIILIQQEPVVTTSNVPYIPGVLNDSLWQIIRLPATNPYGLSLGDTLKSVNNLRPADLFETHCDFYLGVKDLIGQTPMSIVTMSNDSLMIK